MSSETPNDPLSELRSRVSESPEWRVIKDQLKEMALYVVFASSVYVFRLLIVSLGIDPPSELYMQIISHVQWIFICLILVYMSIMTVKKIVWDFEEK
jgi:hypothetical protein